MSRELISKVDEGVGARFDRVERSPTPSAEIGSGWYKAPETRCLGVTDTAFVVEIKPSARRTNGAVGTLVNRRGTRHVFSSRDDAEMWASGLSSRGGVAVWIRRADPRDESDTDAYLVGRRHREQTLAGAYDKRRRRIRGGSDGEQAGFGTFDD